MAYNPDSEAQTFIDSLAETFDYGDNRIIRFTPSLRIGRRYLIVETTDYRYMITVEVEGRGGETQ